MKANTYLVLMHCGPFQKRYCEVKISSCTFYNAMEKANKIYPLWRAYDARKLD